MIRTFNRLLDWLEDRVPRVSGRPDVGKTPVFFCISLAPRRNDEQWSRVSQLLSRTLLAILRQSDGDLTAFVCGHERPDIPAFADRRVRWLNARNPHPEAGTAAGRRDKAAKRRRMLRAVARRGGGFVALFDADDIPRDDFVALIRQHDHPHGYLLEGGYVMNHLSGEVAPVEQALGGVFWEHCGSCAVFRVSREDILGGYMKRFRKHKEWKGEAEAAGRPLMAVGEPLCIYVLHTSQNLSYDWRSERAQARLLDRISRNKVGRESLAGFGL